MTDTKRPGSRSKKILIGILSLVMLGSLLLTAAGINGIHDQNNSAYAGDDIWSQTLALSGAAGNLYRESVAPALERQEEGTRTACTAAARKMLAESWSLPEENLAGFPEEQVWKMLSMTWSYSRRKLSSADRKALDTLGDRNALQDRLLRLIASGEPVSSEAALAGNAALEKADQAKLTQVFLAAGQKDWAVLNRETAMAFSRAAGSDANAAEAIREVTDGRISAVSAWVIQHARTVLLAGILMTLDTLLLFLFLRSDRSWKMDFKWILILVMLDFLLLFQLLPLVYLCVKAFFPDGSFSLDTFTRLYTYRMNWQALTNTLIASACTMALGTLIAFPLAWLVGRSNLYGRKFFRFLFVMTYMVPPYVGAMAWLRLLNRNVGTVNLALRGLFGLQITEGPLNIYSLAGLIWVLTTFYFPYAFITISRAMEKMDPTLEEASRASGANPLTTVIRVTLPMMTPSLIAGALLVFICAASCYGIPSIIGAPGNVHTVTTRIVEYYGMGVKGINDATGLAVFLIAMALLVLFISDLILAKKQYITVSGKSTRPARVDLRRWRIPLTVLVSLFCLTAVGIPFATVLITSFKTDVGKSLFEAGNFTFSQWQSLFRGETLDCLKNSLIFGVITATAGIIVSCTMGYLTQRTRIRGRKLPDFLITLGSGTPSVVIALGLIMTMRGQFGIDLYYTAAILIIAYLIKYLMMGMRTVSSAMSQIHVSLEESSQISGASWLKTMLRITGPLIFPSIAAGWFLIFIPSFYELSMTTLLYSPDTKTIGFQLYQYWTFTSQPQACAMASGILLMIVLLNFILHRLTKGEFSI